VNDCQNDCHSPFFRQGEYHEVRREAVSWRLRAGGKGQERDIVFSNHMGGFLERANINTMLKGLLKQAGLPEIRIHDLRHSAATILLKMNVNPKQVQVLLGHSSIVITMDRYSHVLPDMQRARPLLECARDCRQQHAHLIRPICARLSYHLLHILAC
jgi:integrase